MSNHQRPECFLNRLFRRKSKKTSKASCDWLLWGNSTGDSPHKGPVTRKMFPSDDVIMDRIECARNLNRSMKGKMCNTRFTCEIDHNHNIYASLIYFASIQVRPQNDRNTLRKVRLSYATYQHRFGLRSDVQFIRDAEIYIVHVWFIYVSCLKLTNMRHLLCKILKYVPAMDDCFNKGVWHDANVCLQHNVNIEYVIMDYLLCVFFVHRNMALSWIFKKKGTCIRTCMIILIAMLVLRNIFTQKGKVFCWAVCSLKQVNMCGIFLHRHDKCGGICWLENCFVCIIISLHVVLWR